MLRKVPILLFLCMGFSVPVAAEWTAKQKDLELSYQILHFVDWQQTRYIARHPEDYYEINPILGKHPDKQTVDIYFAASALAHIGISALLPDEFRDYWQMVTLGVKATLVGWNFSIGIRMEL